MRIVVQSQPRELLTHTQKKVGEAGRLAQGVRPEFKPQYRKNRWQ
jgi:hypothetical protein